MMKAACKMYTPLRRSQRLFTSISASVTCPAASVHLDNSLGTKGASSDIHEISLDPKVDKQELYKRWTASVYEEDMASIGYTGPDHVAKEAVAGPTFGNHENGPLTILDAGCGTGLVGEAMWRLLGRGGHCTLIGADISLDMLERAKTRGYAETHQVDMNEPFDKLSTDSFDAVLCSGTFIQGHVAAEPALPEMCRVVRPGGQIIATVRTSIYDDAFKATLAKLETQGHRVEVSVPCS